MMDIEEGESRGAAVVEGSGQKLYRKGDRVNLQNLLFSQKRDFLIRHGGNSEDKLFKVKANDLRNKVVVLHFVLLDPDEAWRWPTNTGQLKELYIELVTSCLFEVVLIAVSNNPDPSHKKLFQQIFRYMPWLAVPFSDRDAREYLAQCFVATDCGKGYLPSSIVISKTGVILQNNALPLFRGYGAEGYPFSDERITYLASQDDEIRRCPSLKALLVSSQRDYVINNKGENVNVSDLEDKVVALYLYEEGWTNKLTESLKKAYEQCVREKKNFEVVLIYISDTYNTCGHTNADSFQKTFEKMPWLALPFKDINCKKVMRIFRYPFELGGPQPDPSLVIIGHGGEIFEPFGGARVLMEFGMEAYPFTCDKAYKLQVEKVKNLKFETLFGPGAVFVRASRPDDSTREEVQFSDIVGKTILVFSETHLNVYYEEFRMKLRERYLERKGKINEFEVIHLGAEDAVPWLTLRDDMGNSADNAEEILHDILRYSGYGIIVFDHDGKVVRARRSPMGFETEGTDFPFSTCLVEEEVVNDIKNLFHWDFWENNSFMDD